MALTPPIHYMLPLYPGFQLLDVAGPLDILNLLSIVHKATSAITLTFIASTLDEVPVKPIGPTDPQTGKPKWTFEGWPAGADGSTNVGFNQTLKPQVTFDEYLSAMRDGKVSSSDPNARYKPIDVLLIPGGMGSRITRVYPESSTSDSDRPKTESNVADLVSFTTAVAPHIRHSIMTVCTGSAILSQTGLLNNRRATTNMTRFDDLAHANTKVRWLKGRRWVRSVPTENDTRGENGSGGGSDGFNHEIWTSAGISAGIDVMLAFVAEYYGGVEVARMAAQRLEYEWREIGEGEVDPMYGFTEEDLRV